MLIRSYSLFKNIGMIKKSCYHNKACDINYVYINAILYSLSLSLFLSLSLPFAIYSIYEAENPCVEEMDCWGGSMAGLRDHCTNRPALLTNWNIEGHYGQYKQLAKEQLDLSVDLDKTDKTCKNSTDTPNGLANKLPFTRSTFPMLT